MAILCLPVSDEPFRPTRGTVACIVSITTQIPCRVERAIADGPKGSSEPGRDTISFITFTIA